MAVASGLKNARALLDRIASGKKKYHFVEIMACPGGCLNGGGQPTTFDVEALKRRLKKIYRIDADHKMRRSHENPSILELYKDFLDKPNSEVAHKYLHTHYHVRPEKF